MYKRQGWNGGLHGKTYCYVESGRQSDKTGKERDRRVDQGVTGAHQREGSRCRKVEVIINELDSSNRDVALISE